MCLLAVQYWSHCCIDELEVLPTKNALHELHNTHASRVQKYGGHAGGPCTMVGTLVAHVPWWARWSTLYHGGRAERPCTMAGTLVAPVPWWARWATLYHGGHAGRPCTMVGKLGESVPWWTRWATLYHASSIMNGHHYIIHYIMNYIHGPW